MTTASAVVGTVGTAGVIATAGSVAGLSAAGITSGLAALRYSHDNEPQATRGSSHEMNRTYILKRWFITWYLWTVIS